MGTGTCFHWWLCNCIHFCQIVMDNEYSSSIYTSASAAKSLQSVSDSVRPHRRQPTRLPHPWDSPGKNTGVGCHFFLQCMNVKSESDVTQSCLMDCSLPGSSAQGIFQARVLEWGAIAFSDIHQYTHVNGPQVFKLMLN